MSAGTITLTNGSAIVGGSGTAFATELSAGDFIVSTVGGVPYTLPVKTVDSDTQLTLVISFTGPTQAGAAWSAVPRVALNMVTAALVAQSAEALRGLNYDKQNWQQVFSGAGTITVRLPDGSTYSGPSWVKVTNEVTDKLSKSQNLSDLADSSAGRENLQLGAGDSPTFSNVVLSTKYDAAAAAGGITNSSLYAANGTTLRARSRSYAEVRSDGKPYHTIAVSNGAGGEAYFSLRGDNGGLFVPGRISGLGGVPNGWLASQTEYSSGIYQSLSTDPAGVSAVIALSYAYQHSGGYRLRTSLGNIGNGTAQWPNTCLVQFGDDGNSGVRYWYFNPLTGDLNNTGGLNFPGSYIFQKAATSDATLKHDIQYNDGVESYENVKKIRPCTFIYNADKKNCVRRGIIAQDVLREVDPEYVKLVPAAPKFDAHGERVDDDDTLALDNNVIMMDTLLALKYVIGQLEETKKELAELKKSLACSE
nr:MAG TPA_asm: tail protein [Caudoviricetes sp.]